MLEGAKQAARPDSQVILGSPLAQFVGEEFGLGLGVLPDRVGMCCDGMSALAADHWLGPYATFPCECFVCFVSAHRVGRNEPETPGRAPAAGLPFNRSRHMFAQIG
jgi:hypothetical protein